MSVLLWWLPALLMVGLAWWVWRPRAARVSQRDLRRMQRALGRGR